MRKYKTPQSLIKLNDNGKYNQHHSQLKTIFHYLKENIATASMISKKTGIPQKCITRYKRDLEKKNLLFELYKKECKVTGFKAWYLTTNKEIFVTHYRKEVKNVK